ncbi:MAG: hypothetical protein SOW78_12435 [Clostridia bacterium]|nr:hypothetical protein [Clostridia bacterium]
MKSSKLKATLAAVSAIAVMASASTSFAATVTTISTYNTDDAKKVSVTATVNGAEADKEVTYLVKSNGAIVYIDQETAKGGTATFAYKIDKSKLAADLSTEVKFGTDSTTNTTFDGTTALGFGKVNATGDDKVTITYWKDAECTNNQITDTTIAAGTQDTVYAKVTVNDPENYEIASVVIGETDYGTSGIYALHAGETITVTTKEKITTPVVVAAEPTVDTNVPDVDGKAVTASVTTVLNVTGTADEYGVLFTVDGVLTAFPAAVGGENTYAAVRILTTDNKEISSANVKPYYKVGGTYYDAKTGTALTAE